MYKSIHYTSILVLHMSKSKSVPFSLPFSDMCPVIGWATNTWLLRTLAASVSCRASPFDSPCLRYLSPTFVAWFLNCCWSAGVRSWSSFSCQRKHEHGGDQIRKWISFTFRHPWLAATAASKVTAAHVSLCKCDATCCCTVNGPFVFTHIKSNALEKLYHI